MTNQLSHRCAVECFEVLWTSVNKYGPYATGRLEDSGRQNDAKMSRKTVHSRSWVTFFRHSAVLSLPAVLLRKVPNDGMVREPAERIHLCRRHKVSYDGVPLRIRRLGLVKNLYQDIGLTSLSCQWYWGRWQVQPISYFWWKFGFI